MSRLKFGTGGSIVPPDPLFFNASPNSSLALHIFDLTLTMPNGRLASDSRIAQIVVLALARAGVQAAVDALPWASFAGRSACQEFAMRLKGWGSVMGAGVHMLANIVQTNSPPRRTGSSNSGRFSSPELDANTDRAASTINDAERDAIIQEATRWVATNPPIMPIVQLTHAWATRPGLTYQARMDERTVAMGARPATSGLAFLTGEGRGSDEFASFLSHGRINLSVIFF